MFHIEKISSFDSPDLQFYKYAAPTALAFADRYPMEICWLIFFFAI